MPSSPMPAMKPVMVADHMEPLLCKYGAPFDSINFAVLGGASFGKSTLVNGLASAFSTESETPVVSRGGTAVGGQHSKRPQRIPLFKWYLRGRKATRDFEANMFDLVGHRSLEETMAYVRGQVKSNEEYPLSNEDGALGKVLSRPFEPRDAMTCLLMLVPASVIVTPQHKMITDMKQLLQQTENFALYKTTRVSLPVVLVITMVDDTPYGKQYGKECLLYGESGPLKPLYDAASENLGIAPRDVICTGWLNSTTIDYGDKADPCVAALRLTLLEAVKRSVIPLRQIENL